MNTNTESPQQGFWQSAFWSPSGECRRPRSSREMINLIRVNSCLFAVFYCMETALANEAIPDPAMSIL